MLSFYLLFRPSGNTEGLPARGSEKNISVLGMVAKGHKNGAADLMAFCVYVFLLLYLLLMCCTFLNRETDVEFFLSYRCRNG